MAQLNSPGVSVTVIDESFYTPAAPGTTPLIVVASGENKKNGAGTGTAPGTLKANAGKVYLVTSQKDLADTFGTPYFETDANNNPVHAGERNEYGLQAAYSYLGVSNRAYVVRADLDTTQLQPSAFPPAGEPDNNTFWFDTASTNFGVFEWNGAGLDKTGGQKFTHKIPTTITEVTKLEEDKMTPLASIGKAGDYAVVATTSLIKLWYKKAKTTNTNPVGWVEVGSPEWVESWPTVQVAATGFDETKTLSINTTDITMPGSSSVSALASAINAATITGVTAAAIEGNLVIYSRVNSVTVSGTLATALGISGTFSPPRLQTSPHFNVPTYKYNDQEPAPTGSLWIKTTTPNLGAKFAVKKYSTTTKAWSAVSAPLYANGHEALYGMDKAGGGINLAQDAVFVKFNDSEDSSLMADYKLYRRKRSGATVIKSVSITDQLGAGSYTFKIKESETGKSALKAEVSVSFSGDVDPVVSAKALISALQAALGTDTAIRAERIEATNQITISHINGGEIRFEDTVGAAIGSIFVAPNPTNSAEPKIITENFYVDPYYTAETPSIKHFVASLWCPFVFDDAGNRVSFATNSATAPSTLTADGRLWYDNVISEVDIMIHNGTTWVAYRNDKPLTDSNGPIISATKPTKPTDGRSALVTGDLWIDTSDTENFPKVYKYNADVNPKTWTLVDSTDQTTEDGILFKDARWNTTGKTGAPSTITELLGGTEIPETDAAANFLDPDAPDPALYPKGMLLWNLRRSGYNVKRFVRNYIDTTKTNLRFEVEAGENKVPESMEEYYPHRWVSEAANQENGAGTFGRKAQRQVVIQRLQALVNSNQQIRDEESRIFNLIACPGYPELINELVNLNYDRGLTAFVVGDTPARLTPDATTISNWGQNTSGALENNDSGLVTFDEYLGVFYPWGYTSDNLGNNVVVPPSHMMLRTIALSDQVSYPWFAPAGTRRGGITNASAVGYVTADGEFQSVALNTGQRDTLQQQAKVNPITFITGTGLVNYGQLTRAKNASALDRINVARLVIYLRRQFAQLAKPYVFEPNDKITRDEIKGAAESLLLELVGQRALYDYVVVCDTSNNTPARIDRNELYLDVAIEPVKAVEFIYIPLRLKNTGEIKALGK